MDVRCLAFLLAVAAALGCGTSGSPTPAESGKLGRGSLDKKVIKDVISEHHREVRGCYEVQLVKQPDLAGRVLSQFTISTTGNVTDVVLRESTVGNPAIEECLRKHLLTWKFPKPHGGGSVDVIYAFDFFPSP
jgi:outer membrane biosynthesis protein TonB